jgi:hypothetical protein
VTVRSGYNLYCTVVFYGMCPVTQGPYCTFLSPFLLFLSCALLDYSVLSFQQQQMVVIELSPNDHLTFDVEDISDSMQSSNTISCRSTLEDSFVLIEVTLNPPLQYSISPSTGFLLMNKPDQ